MLLALESTVLVVSDDAADGIARILSGISVSDVFSVLCVSVDASSDVERL